MNLWFWALVILSAISLGINIGKHGEPRSNYNGWVTLIAGILDIFLIIMAIRHGGF